MTDRELEQEIKAVEQQIHELWQEGLTKLMLAHRASTDALKQSYDYGDDDEVGRVLELGYLTTLRNIRDLGRSRAAE